MRAAFPPVSTEAWLRKIAEDLKGADYEQRLVWMPPEGFAVQPFYRAEDLSAGHEPQEVAAVEVGTLAQDDKVGDT